MSNSFIKQDLVNIANSIKTDYKKLEGKTLLLSGGAGFIGSYILATINYLNNNKLSKPCKVISIDNFITGKRENLFGKFEKKYVEFIEADIEKPLDITSKIDYIIHAAGIASPVYYSKYPIQTIRGAVDGTANLLEFARYKKIKSFLYFSSSEVYGNPETKFVPTPETYNGNVSPVSIRASYDESKRLGETICMTYFRLYKIPIKIVRPFNIYGPGMYPDDYRVIPNYVSKALSGKPLSVYDKGFQTRTFCYISDAIAGFLKALLSKKNGQIYNIGNDDLELSMLDLAKLITNIIPDSRISVRKHPTNYPAGNIERRCPDISKAMELLKYNPHIDLKTGLKRVVKWYRKEFPELKKSK